MNLANEFYIGMLKLYKKNNTSEKKNIFLINGAYFVFKMCEAMN